MDPEVFSKVVERKIQEAIEEGKFDNLPGKGKPIVFDDDPMTPPHLRLANKILKNAGALPDWIQVQKDILTERQEVVAQRARLVRENQARRARLSSLPADHADVRAFAVWHARSREAYLRRLKGVNNSILKFSLMAPSTAPNYRPYKIEEEMAVFDAEFLTLAHQPAMDPAEIAERAPSALQGIARARYTEGGGSVLGVMKYGRMLGEFGGSGIPEGTESEDIWRADVPEEGKRKP